MISLRRLRPVTFIRSSSIFVCESKRLLFSWSSLGLDAFTKRSLVVQETVKDVNALKNQIKEIYENDETGTILLGDLKTMVRITKNEEDLEFLFSLIKKFYNQKSETVSRSYAFATEIMRLLHIMNKPKEALKLIEDEDLFPHFQQVTTFLVLLDLLFKNGQYEDVIRIYKYYTDEVEFNSPQLNAFFLVLAACYKLNNEKYFEEAVEIHNKLVTNNVNLPLKNIVLFGALAIKFNQPREAIQAFSLLRDNTWGKNFELMALAQAKCFGELCSQLKDIVQYPLRHQYFLSREAVVFIEKLFKDSTDNTELKLEFEELIKKLDDKGFINDKPLDKYLFAEVTFKRHLSSKLDEFK